jgi:hypothetical protein
LVSTASARYFSLMVASYCMSPTNSFFRLL